MISAVKQVAGVTVIAALVGISVAIFLAERAEAGGPYQTYTCVPCRVLDTRDGSGDATGGDPHRIAPNETITIDVAESFITGQGGASDCGVPFPEAKGVFINVVAVQPPGAIQVANPKSNYLTLYPFTGTKPTAASLNYNPDDWALANAIFVSLCADLNPPSGSGCADDLAIYNGTNAYVDVVIDVTGWVQ